MCLERIGFGCVFSHLSVQIVKKINNNIDFWNLAIESSNYCDVDKPYTQIFFQKGKGFVEFQTVQIRLLINLERNYYVSTSKNLKALFVYLKININFELPSVCYNFDILDSKFLIYLLRRQLPPTLQVAVLIACFVSNHEKYQIGEMPDFDLACQSKYLSFSQIFLSFYETGPPQTNVRIDFQHIKFGDRTF